MVKLGRFLKHFENPKILDIGTGNGNFIKIVMSLTDYFEEIIGIDNLDIAVSTAAKNFTDERIKIMKMDAFKMDFEDGYFDLVCLSNSLHHLADIPAMIKEMERVIKPGGYLLVNEMISDGLSVRQKSHMKIHHFAAEVDREFGDSHNETFKAKEMLTLLENTSILKIKDAWNMSYEKAEENTEEEIEWLLNTIDKIAAKVTDEDRIPYFIKKSDKIKKYISKVGFDSATQLVVILK